MNTLTEEQHDAMTDQFFQDIKNPSEKLISKTLEQLGVWIWGDYIASRDILDVSNEPSLSGHDLARMDEETHTWLDENLDNAIDVGNYPKQPSLPETIKLHSSQLFPVEKDLLLLVESILNTFDAFVMDNTVYRASYFKENLPYCYSRTCCDMFDWDDQWIEENSTEEPA